MENFPRSKHTTEVQFGKIHSLGIKTCGPAFPVTALKPTSTWRGRRGEGGQVNLQQADGCEARCFISKHHPEGQRVGRDDK